MAEQQYDLFFNGSLLDGFYVDFVKADVKTLFKAADTYVDQLFNGDEQIIKQAVDKATAVKFQKAFKKAGAKLIVRAHVERQAQPKAPIPSNAEGYTKPAEQSSTPVTTPITAQPPVGTFTTTNAPLAGENNADIIEHHQPPLTAPDTGPNWDIAAAGTTLVEAKPFVAVDIDTDNLTLAAAGESLLQSSAFESPAPIINTDNLSIMAPGTNLETLQETKPPVQVDLSHIQLITGE